MDVFTMVVVIVAIACTAGIVEKYLKVRRSEASQGVNDEVYDELERLRERVEVLEKIVTDERYDLAKEIGRLERQA
jgi:hypothetical protein